jgi:AraC-like DNA-binding protein
MSRDYVLGRQSVHWHLEDDLVGAIFWGGLDSSDLETISMVLWGSPYAGSMSVVLDCGDVENVDGNLLLDLIRSPRQLPPGRGRRAIIVPHGLTGVLLVGALQMLLPAQSMKFTHDRNEALQFVAHPSAARTHAVGAALAVNARSVPPIIQRLHTQLARDLIHPRITTSARVLGVSPRSLQRELRSHGTSFSHELRRVRVTAAKALLQNTRAKVDVVAQRVGITSPSWLSALLRRELRLTASDVRAGRAVQDSIRSRSLMPSGNAGSEPDPL